MIAARADTILLFGSAAREDTSPGSDVDFLVISDGAHPKAVKEEGLEFHFLSRSMASEKARLGDLFLAHVVVEGKVITDPSNYFSELRESFQVKESYKSEREEAYLLAACLARYPNEDVEDLFFKRMAWCLRTVLISELLERRKFVFSPKGLYREYNNSIVEYLLSLRRGNHDFAVSQQYMKDFLAWKGYNHLLKYDINKIISIMKCNNFSVALSTLGKLSAHKFDSSNQVYC